MTKLSAAYLFVVGATYTGVNLYLKIRMFAGLPSSDVFNAGDTSLPLPLPFPLPSPPLP